ncbi:aldehyde dehydrogenase [Pseudomonas sp. BAY1663]|nr:aldehyde dehydrogenase [Pseudomonas sp. BAY1663]
MIYAQPGTAGAVVSFKPRYGNYIGGEFVPPVKGEYFVNTSPVNGEVIAEFPRSGAEDVEKALDAAHAAADAWGRTSVQDRANILLKIADRIEANLEKLAVAETWDNGKAVRETLNADVPLAADHFRYFAGCIRAQEGSAAEINEHTAAYHFHEPLGVVGQIIPWNFPLLMAAWKLAPALAAGNCVVLKPAEQTPLSIMVFAEVIGDLLPPGVLNIVQGFGKEAGQALATSTRIAKIAFTGSTPVGAHIMRCAAENIIPSTVELGGKSPNIFFEDIMQAEPAFIEKAAEGLVLAFFNQGEVCTCPSRALIQESIFEPFMNEVMKKVKQIKRGNPLDTDTMVGAQASEQQFDKILSYLDIAQQEGAQVLTGGAAENSRAAWQAVTTSSRPCSRGTTRCACSRRKSSGRWSASPPSRTRPRRWPSPTTPNSASAPASGPATSTAPTAWAAASSRPGVDQLLPSVSGACRIRWLQEVRRRSRDPQDDARPLPADQEPAGQLRRQSARLLLMRAPARVLPRAGSFAAHFIVRDLFRFSCIPLPGRTVHRNAASAAFF